MYNLSEKAIAEKYEDLLFTKVMALYAAEESENILSEIENEEPADPKNIEKIYSKTERRENFSNLWKVSKKLITFAAMVVFVAVVSLSSVVVASAEAREAVAEAIYHLVLRKTDRYTEVSIGNSTGFIDPEIYDWEGAYAPTYIPEGFVFSEKQELTTRAIITYSNGEKYFSITQSNQTSNLHMDTENAQKIETIKINDSAGLLVEKNGFSSLAWNDGSNFFWLRGETDSAELIKVAEGLKPLGKTETEEPAEEYEFVDPEIYTWDNAYGMTYVPDGFNLSGVYKHPGQSIIDYSKENEYFSFLQAQEASADVDTENAQIVERIIINNSEGLLVVKNGLTQVVWSEKNIYMAIIGTAPTEEIIKIAESIRPIEKYEAPAEEYEFIDAEVFNWEGAFAPTYIPKNFEISDIDIAPDCPAVTYSKGKQFFVIYQLTEGAKARIDSENAEVYKTVFINGNEGLFIKKADEISITWNDGNIFFWLFGTTDEKELLKVAEGLKPLGKTEESAEEYEFVDPEIYTWENAFALTYIPEKYALDEIYDLDLLKIVNYVSGEKYFSFSQLREETIYADTENADKIKDIIIGNSKGLLITKDVISSVYWSVENTLLSVTGNIDENEIIKIAEGIKPIN